LSNRALGWFVGLADADQPGRHRLWLNSSATGHTCP
jgi:hypothetical protein